jgi:hypothetical protein
VGGQGHAPAALPLGRTRYPLSRRLGGPQGRSGRVRKISPQPGFDPRTVQPVASRYTDRAVPAHTYFTPTNSNYCVFVTLLHILQMYLFMYLRFNPAGNTVPLFFWVRLSDIAKCFKIGIGFHMNNIQRRST